MTFAPLTFAPINTADRNELLSFLLAHEWPYHGAAYLDRDSLEQRLDEAWMPSASTRAFWITHDADGRVGTIRLMELDDPTPVFDIRLAPPFRGRGFGRIVVRWLAEHVFTTTEHRRIEGYTRIDNHPMRAVFNHCGWVKEAHHRAAWPTAEGQHVDAIGYGITKEDWRTGTVTPVQWGD